MLIIALDGSRDLDAHVFILMVWSTTFYMVFYYYPYMRKCDQTLVPNMYTRDCWWINFILRVLGIIQCICGT